MSILSTLTIDWYCMHTWLQASKNTLWCLLGCCIGDFGTIGFFQFMEIAWPVSLIMTLAIINGIITSIILETIILSKQKLMTPKILTKRYSTCPEMKAFKEKS